MEFFLFKDTSRGVEVDIIVEKPKKVPVLIEIKSSTDVKKTGISIK